MQKLFLICALLVSMGTTGCGSSNPDAPSAPKESDVPKGDGSAPVSEPGVVKAPRGKKASGNAPMER